MTVAEFLHGKHVLHSIAKIFNSNDYNILQWNLYEADTLS